MAEETPAATAKSKGSSERKRSSSATRTGSTLSTQIVEILTESKQRKGTSVYHIKKILGVKGVDVKKLNGRINAALKQLVLNGRIVQVSGIGASGSFKLAKLEPSKSKSNKALANSSGRKNVGKVRVKKTGTAKKDKKREDKNIKKPAAKKSPKKREQKRRAKLSPKKFGKAAPKKQKRSSQKRVTQRKSGTSRKTSGKGKK